MAQSQLWIDLLRRFVNKNSYIWSHAHTAHAMDVVWPTDLAL